MCGPALMAAQIGLTAASAGMGLYNQAQQRKAEQANFKYVQGQAALDANATYSQLARRLEQENTAASQAVQENLDRSISATASTRVAAAAAGASGASLDALMRDYQMSSMQYAQRVSRQRALSEAENIMAQKGVKAQYTERVMQAAPRLPGPDYIGAFLQIGQGAVNSYFQNTVYDPSKGKRVFA
jgi:hypothetical protein